MKKIYFTFAILLFAPSLFSALTSNTIGDTLLNICLEKDADTLKRFLTVQSQSLSWNEFDILMNTTTSSKCSMLQLLVKLTLENDKTDLTKLETFIQFKPNPNIRTSLQLFTLLHHFSGNATSKNDCTKNCITILKLLNSINQNFNCKNLNNETALDFIMEYCLKSSTVPIDETLKITEQLLSFGANPTVESRSTTNPYGWSAINISYLNADFNEKYKKMYELFRKHKFYPSYYTIKTNDCCNIL